MKQLTLGLVTFHSLMATNSNNKSNSMADAVQVEANLQEHLRDRLYFRKQCC